MESRASPCAISIFARDSRRYVNTFFAITSTRGSIS